MFKKKKKNIHSLPGSALKAKEVIHVVVIVFDKHI